jgi:hypothetical protein
MTTPASLARSSGISDSQVRESFLAFVINPARSWIPVQQGPLILERESVPLDTGF